MITYVFTCYEEDGGCGHTFEVEAHMSDVKGLKPRCPECRKIKSVARDFCAEDKSFVDASPTTVAALAERNTSRLSTDEKHHIHKKLNAYRDKPYTGPMPKDGSLVPRDADGKRIPSTKTHTKDPRKK